jgi:hypothetical protein
LLADGLQRKRESVIKHAHGLILNINRRSVELKSLNGQLYNLVVSQNPSQSSAEPRHNPYKPSHLQRIGFESQFVRVHSMRRPQL